MAGPAGTLWFQSDVQAVCRRILYARMSQSEPAAQPAAAGLVQLVDVVHVHHAQYVSRGFMNTPAPCSP